MILTTDTTKVAIAINPNLGIGFLANTVGAIGIGLGASTPKLGNIQLTDIDGISIMISSCLPIPILEANNEQLQVILKKAHDMRENGKEIKMVVFPEFARSMHNFSEYREIFPGTKLSTEEIGGIGVVGEKKSVNSLTGALKLLR